MWKGKKETPLGIDLLKKMFNDKEENSDDSLFDPEEKSSINESDDGIHGEMEDITSGSVSKRKLKEDQANDLPKRHRGEHRSVVADSFATEAEIEYSDAKIDPETGLKSNQDNKLVLSHDIRHEVAIPTEYSYENIMNHKPLDPPNRTYPFTLDPFQRISINCIERNESVLVAAHTSAGKTVIAEYAIATSLKKKQRVIYTSPIKALSNQKYRELAEEFVDVGLMTGDITINPSATCLVMTTEILRSMMYRGSEIMREVAWVIFDEIHYMRDKERGVVWEETIILLPHKVRYVFLSATIPNAKQFAEWICNIHDQPCHVVYTNFRPTPLQHYVFPSQGNGIHLCVDEKGNFREENFVRALASLGNSSERSEKLGRKGGRKDIRGQTDLFKILKMIWQRNYLPVIVFSFSKRECESNAIQMNKMCFNDDDEKNLVSEIYESAMQSLSPDDRKLPQIESFLPLLQRGIGIHHSGLLQILKEVIELLFQEGLIKVLFATETFSIGLNMPAKTVVFTSVKKFDGKTNRPLGSGEYIQMSGRAGRRGLDDRGIVIMMMDEQMEPTVVKNMLHGAPDRLFSAFHLTYSMIINMMRVEGISPEYMLQRSFYQFQNSDELPALDNALKELEEKKDEIKIDDEELIAQYHTTFMQLEAYKNDMKEVIRHPSHCLPFLQPGRLVHIKSQDLDYGWCVIINYSKKKSSTGRLGKEEVPGEARYILDVAAHCSAGYSKKLDNGQIFMPPPCAEDKKGEMLIIPAELSSYVHEISSIRIHVPRDIKSVDSRNSLLKIINEVKRRFAGDIPLLDPVEDMRIKDKIFLEIVEKVQILKSTLQKNPLCLPGMEAVLSRKKEEYSKKIDIENQIRYLKTKIKESEEILQLEELKKRKRVLRRLGYVNEDDVVDVKGRVACEITTGDELVLSELLFNGTFNDLSPQQIAALLSCFVCQEKSSDETAQIRSEMIVPIKSLREISSKVARISSEAGLAIDEKEYVESFLDSMVNPVYAWSDGSKFFEICKMTDIFEGSIIRIIRRLEELLRQMGAASKQIGNEYLEKKFMDASSTIKRDIVFAASLYL